jgi:lipid II:glycine glycyltransferase (peptidoglycan interpeptide bridge formation enzyme)
MISLITDKDKKAFDRLAPHPLQTFAWGEFREKTGAEVIRLGRWEADELVETAQITLHTIPKTAFKVGYLPKGAMPSEEMVMAIKEYASKKKTILVKMEPNVVESEEGSEFFALAKKFSMKRGREMFTRYSLWLDLDKSEDQLLAGMNPKTRYNTRLAERKGVTVAIENTPEAFEEYWKLMEETTKRQGFYAHSKKYHQQMFETMVNSKIGNLFVARFEGKVLVTWMVFLVNGILYYPYGASTRDDRNVFASNLMMWNVIKWGLAQNAKLFDMWGSLGETPDETDPWYGFHRFKTGFGARVVKFVGSFDLVINPLLYFGFNILNDKLRWTVLRARAALLRRG